MGFLGDLNPLSLKPQVSYEKVGGKHYYRMLGFDAAQLDISRLNQLVYEGYVTNPYVYTVVSHILRVGYSIPWNVYQVKDEGALKEYVAAKSIRSDVGLERLTTLQVKAVDVLSDKTHWANKLLWSPNDKMIWNDLVAAWMGSRLLTGNCYLYEPTSELRSIPRQLIPLPGQLMSMECDGWLGVPKKYKLTLGVNKFVEFDTSEISHSALYNPMIDHESLSPYGLSPMASLGKVIKTSNDGFLAQMRLLENGHPLGILSNASNEPMWERQRLELAGETDPATGEEYQLQDFAGAGNKGKIKLTTANLKWINMGLNSTDLQIVEAQNASVMDICGVYGFPYELIRQGSAGVNTKKEAEKRLWNDAILPHYDAFREHINKHLFKRDRGLFIDYDHHSIPSLQQDREKLWKIVEGMLGKHMITPEKANKIMGVDNDDTDPNLKRYLLQTNLRWGDEELPGQTGKTGGTKK